MFAPQALQEMEMASSSASTRVPSKEGAMDQERLSGTAILRKHTHQATLLTNQLCNVKLAPLKRETVNCILPEPPFKKDFSGM